MKTIKYSILFVLILFLNISLFSRSNIVVKYTYINSLGNPNANDKVYNSGLYITKNKSLFVAQIDSLENGGKQISKVLKDKNGNYNIVKSFSGKDGFYTIIDREKDTLYGNTEL